MKTESRENLLESLAAAVLKRNESIVSVRPPDKTKAVSYKEALQRVRDLRGRELFYPYTGSGRGRGALVELLDGSVKLDFICGIGVHILGHGHPEMLRAALQGALEDISAQGHLQANEIYIQTLQKLTALAGRKSRLKFGWLCPSGSMANENSLKVIRQKKKAARFIVAFERAFAGRTSLMAEINANPKTREGLPSYGEVLRIPFCPEDPEEALDALKKHQREKGDQIACLMVELLQGDGGCRLAPASFFKPLFEFCRNREIAVWADEIQTFGRTGELFAFEKLGLGEFMDVVTVGKAFQMSASLWTEEFNPKPGLVSGTFAGATVSLHCAKTVLDVLERGFMGPDGRIEACFKAWTARLRSLEACGLLSDIDGAGLMTGATPLDGKPATTDRLLRLLFQKGLIVFSCGHGKVKRLRFLLPAVALKSDLDQAAALLKEALREIKQSL